ncbi:MULTISPECIES: hypothetical protein [unclassified Streptomyces]|uniref:hypothetical protein n=1 Tax=unclassified Streptomyces TaxID=2593676 RepID=UPI003701A08C
MQTTDPADPGPIPASPIEVRKIEPGAIQTGDVLEDMRNRKPISDGTMPCPVPAPETGHPCVKRIPKGWAAAEGHGGGHFWHAPRVAELEARGAHYDPSTLLSGQPTSWHLPEDCAPGCWKWRG